MSAREPLVVELFCGRFGWSRGFVAEGYRSVGFDIAHEPYHGNVPADCSLALQDVLTLHGSQFKDAACIVASPPCQEYSYMAMPWSRAKQIAAALRGKGEFPEGYTGSRTVPQLTALFDACFRIQREACEAAGRYIPMVVENVKGAQPWVGPAKAHFGSFYLWGDIESVGGRITIGEFGQTLRPAKNQKFNPDGTEHGQGSWFAVADSNNRGARDGQKVPGFNFHEFEKTGQPGRSFQSSAVEGMKNGGGSWFNVAHNTESGVGQNPVNGVKSEGVKQVGEWLGKYRPGQHGRSTGSGSSARKAASAMIAEIPYDLARWVAYSFHPGRYRYSQAGIDRARKRK